MTQDRAEQDQHLSWIFESERRRLLAFIRRRIPDEIDAEDLLQDVSYELVEAYRLMKPVAHAGALMMQVAKNRITDLFRRGKTLVVADESRRILVNLLPSPDAGAVLFARGVLLAEIEAALGELPPSQREVLCASPNGANPIRKESRATCAWIRYIRVNTMASRGSIISTPSHGDPVDFAGLEHRRICGAAYWVP